MAENRMLNQVKSKWVDNGHVLLFTLLLFVFAAYTIFLSLNLKPGLIPDESYHFAISKHFATTWGIPNNVPEAQSAGKSLQQNSFLGYWIYGRVLTVFYSVSPIAADRQALVILRIVNAMFSWGTVIATYLISKEVIKNKWLQLLPVFMLTNTLMFVFLSAGVNYDNPAILFCSLSLLFFIKALLHKNFVTNSLAWWIFICIACLIKYTILPLTFFMSVLWIIFIFKESPEVSLTSLYNKKNIPLALLLLALIGANFCIYGINLIRYRSIIPACTDVYSEEICVVNTFAIRHQEMALPEKLTLKEAFRQGNPEPIRYVFDFWLRAMLDRIFGIMGHEIYFPISVSYFLMMLFWSIGLGMRYIQKPDFLFTSILTIIIAYALVLIRMNYNSELVYGFNTAVALQGRYIFPVITIAYALWGYIMENVTNKRVRFVSIFFLIALFLYGGPIRFIWYYNSVFADWFI
ncbi:MAG: glycosyltransferase family 39 protein [Chloroflexi bacterium]|nr:glycosyltransferase family 39 protein [Chloroflexota bacterium]